MEILDNKKIGWNFYGTIDPDINGGQGLRTYRNTYVLIYGNKTMNIEGMMCMHCKAHVEKALQAIPGVTVQVDLEAGQAAVTCPDTVTVEDLTKAVTEAGYTVKGVE